MSFEEGRQYLLNVIQEIERVREHVITNNDRVIDEQDIAVGVKTDELESMNGAVKKVAKNKRRPRSSRKKSRR